MTRDDVSPTTTYRDSSSRPLCERLSSSQLLGADVMKSLLALTLAAALAVACSKTEQQQADSAPPPSSGAQPASPQPASPPPAVTSPAPTAESAQAPAPQKSAAPAKPAPSSPATSASTAPSPSAAPAPPQKPVEPPPPEFRTVTIPAGTSLAVSVLSNLGSKTSQVEDLVKGAMAKSLVIDGITAVPKGAEVRGVVSDAKESGRVKGKATLGIAFDRLVVRGETHQLQTAPVVLEAQDKKSDDVKKGGLGAGVGAVVGGIAGGGTGAAIGAVAGGAGTVLATKGKEVEVPAGTIVNVLLQSPLTLQVPIKQQ